MWEILILENNTCMGVNDNDPATHTERTHPRHFYIKNGPTTTPTFKKKMGDDFLNNDYPWTHIRSSPAKVSLSREIPVSERWCACSRFLRETSGVWLTLVIYSLTPSCRLTWFDGAEPPMLSVGNFDQLFPRMRLLLPHRTPAASGVPGTNSAAREE